MAQLDDMLERLGTAFGTRNASARSTAALLSNPGCDRRAVLDAAKVNLVQVAKRVGAEGPFGQSPFAIGQGNRFEQRIKQDNYAALAGAINELLHMFDGVDELESVNVERVKIRPGMSLIQSRAEATAEILEAIANGDPSAPHVVDHGVTRLDVGGNTVYLEQDALAFRVGDRLRICEIKGFPIIDGTASPTKVGAAGRQTAVYVASIQDTLAARGFDPELVSPEVVLVCPKNFSITPTAVSVNVDREVRALRRQLRRRTNIGAVLQRLHDDALASGADLDAALAAVADAPKDPDVASRLIDLLPYRYVPECLSECDLARHCRQCSTGADEPGRLGGDVEALLGGLPTVAGALDLVDGRTPTGDEREVAELLRAANLAIHDALDATEDMA